MPHSSCTIVSDSMESPGPMNPLNWWVAHRSRAGVIEGA